MKTCFHSCPHQNQNFSLMSQSRRSCSSRVTLVSLVSGTRVVNQTRSYKKFVLLDFNASTEDSFMKSFCENYNLRSLVKEPTYFKHLENFSFIDLILTSKKWSFIKTGVVETALSNYHKLVAKVIKMHFPKSKASLLREVTKSLVIKC